MEANLPVFILILIGLLAGVSAGLFGIGGGILVVPALIYILGFSPHEATGTSLAILLPPVGLAAVIEYHQNGNVHWLAAAVVALAMFAGAWGGALFAHRLSGPMLRLLFGLFVTIIGIYMIGGSAKVLKSQDSNKAHDTHLDEAPKI